MHRTFIRSCQLTLAFRYDCIASLLSPVAEKGLLLFSADLVHAAVFYTASRTK